jgi:hypothetical protein
MLKSISAARDAAMRSAAHARGVFSSLTVSQTQTQIY